MNGQIIQQPSCQDGQDSSVSFQQALTMIQQQVSPSGGVEALAIRSALGRVLAQPVISAANVPPHRNSAMDGYALNARELPEQDSRELEVVGVAWAGAPYKGELQAGQCVRIMTGAKMPDEADCVVIQEQAQEIDPQRIRIGGGHRAGQNIRHPGEDIQTGQHILPAGKRISPAELGLLASLGIAELKVHRRVRAAFFTSGDELKSIGQVLEEGQIYDSNRYTLYGMLSELGVDIIDMGVVPDSEQTLRQALNDAAHSADLVLTTGGISVGAADHLKHLIHNEGEVLFSKVAIKPGRPVTFGRWKQAWYFGLPGNPVAAMATFYHFVRPALRQLQGEPAAPASYLSARAERGLKKAPGRTEIQRGFLYQGDDGQWWVRSTGKQGSGVLSSMSQGNCFILLHDAQAEIAAGQLVSVEPFDLLRF